MSDVPSALQIEAVEADAWAELQLSLPIDFRERLGIHVRRRHGATLLLAVGTREVAINRVIGLGLDSPLSEQQLADVVSEYAAASVPRFIIQWSPAAQPVRAIEWFTDHGFVLLSRITKLYRVMDGLAQFAERAASIRVEEIERSQGDLFEHIVAKALGVPDGLGLGIRSTVGKPGGTSTSHTTGHVRSPALHSFLPRVAVGSASEPLCLPTAVAARRAHCSPAE